MTKNGNLKMAYKLLAIKDSCYWGAKKSLLIFKHFAMILYELFYYTDD